MPESAGSQFFHGTKPVFVRRSGRAASGLPKLMRQGCDLIVSEGRNTMSSGSCMTVLLSLRRVLELMPRMLMSRQMVLLSVLLAHTVGVCRGIV